MALSVMRDAPVLMQVANPSSHDRTPRRAIVSAVSPAAAPYRASGLVPWRFADARPRRVASTLLVAVAPVVSRGGRSPMSPKFSRADIPAASVLSQESNGTGLNID